MTAQHLKRRWVIYKPVPGFDGYIAGSDGTVWSYHNPRGTWRLSPRRLKAHPNKDGHLVVILRRGGKPIHRFVHQVVLTTFVGACPEGMEACHDPDPDPANNRLENLRWDTRKANSSDCIKHGRRPRGESHGRAKITAADIPVIREAVARGERMAEIGRRYGLAGGHIRKIADGKLWAHVPFCEPAVSASSLNGHGPNGGGR